MQEKLPAAFRVGMKEPKHHPQSWIQANSLKDTQARHQAVHWEAFEKLFKDESCEMITRFCEPAVKLCLMMDEKRIAEKTMMSFGLEGSQSQSDHRKKTFVEQATLLDKHHNGTEQIAEMQNLIRQYEEDTRLVLEALKEAIVTLHRTLENDGTEQNSHAPGTHVKRASGLIAGLEAQRKELEKKRNNMRKGA